MEPMNACRARKEHERALARYDFHSFCFAELNCFRADGAPACSPVHPYLLNASFVAVLDHFFRDCRRSHEKGGFYGRLNVLHSSETVPAGYARSCRVYRDHIVTSAAEFFKKRHAEVFCIAGYANHCDPLLRKKILNHLERRM